MKALFLLLTLLGLISGQDLPLKSSQNGVTLADLEFYLMYAYSAYCSNPQANLDTWSCYWCTLNSKVQPVSQLRTFDHSSDNIFGYAGTTGRFNILAFRGTQATSIANWIKNIDTILVDAPYCSGCKVHQGFFTAYESVRPNVTENIQRLSQNGLPWVLTGHSLGAALSVHAAADMVSALGIRPSLLVNFGDPRVGDQKFASWLDGAVSPRLRVVNQRDIVPHLPPRAFTFWHISTEYWFPKNDTYFRQCDGSGEDPSCSDSVVGDSIPDHVSYLGFELHSGNPYYC